MKRPSVATIALLVAVPLLASPPTAVAGATTVAVAPGNSAVYPPGARVRGRSRASWLAELGRWELEIPAAESPLLRPDVPANCTTDEFAVAYLNLPTSLGRSKRPCVVPAGMPVHLMPFSWECSTAEARAGLQPRRFHGRSYRNLRRCAETMFVRDLGPRAARIRLWIDGRRISRVHQYAVTSRPRVAQVPEDSVFEALVPGADVPAGPTRTIRRSLQLILKPLAPGRHRLRMVARVPAFGPEPFREHWDIRVPR